MIFSEFLVAGLCGHALFLSMIFSEFLVAGLCGHGMTFQLCHLMHMTVIVLNFTRGEGSK
ncbi:hypothetical protein PVAP13_8KG076820 [Panicum virgatum]|uniref:Uncharacterized protein n=1 Tax=Panicum virgatum TaxID=38727 RepID=A0A8T0PRB0_PANVG|nr:hypothetical protein PVAP13_8KG076820 [Panicum virgatum]